MKIVPILFPYPCRGEPAPYLCTFLRSINTRLPQSAYYIVDPACLDWDRFKDRWEFEPWNQGFHEYRIDEKLKPTLLEFLDESLFDPLIRQHVTPIRAWRSLILERYEPLENFLDAALSRAETSLGGIDCVLTWLNVASLKHVCTVRGIPLVHNEHGPLRKPIWRHTAYFDFGGVNGQTNAVHEYADFCRELQDWNEWPSLRSLRNTLITNPVPAQPAGAATYRCGVATQLEEDSNLIAFGNGFSSFDVVRHCQRRVGTTNVLTRLHPMGMSILCGQLDTSIGAVQFIEQCEEIHTINSSVAAEALLFGKTVFTYGDTPLRAAMRPLPDGDGAIWTTAGTEFRERSATFFFLSYLMPYSLAFDPDYIDWRLQQPSHLQRMVTHLRQYCGMPPRYEAGPRDTLSAEFHQLLARLNNMDKEATPLPELATAKALVFEGVPTFYRQIEERNELQQKCEALQHECDTLYRERDNLHRERDAILSSKSWRITAPLRWLDAKFRPRKPG